MKKLVLLLCLFTSLVCTSQTIVGLSKMPDIGTVSSGVVHVGIFDGSGYFKKITKANFITDLGITTANIYNSDGTMTDDIRTAIFIKQLNLQSQNGFSALNLNETLKLSILSGTHSFAQTKYTYVIARNDLANNEAYGAIQSFTSDTTYVEVKANAWTNEIVDRVINSTDSMFITQDKNDVKFRHNTGNLIEINTAGINAFDGVMPTSGNSTDSVVRRNASSGQFYLSPIGVSGTYQPTLTSVTNITATTAYSTTKYYRTGDMVTVFGKFIVDPTGTGAVEMGLSLPIASALTGDDDVAGTAANPAITGEVLSISADATNDRAAVKWVATDVSSRTVYFHFSYQIK